MNIFNNTITFREITKLVHPDLNPAITEPSLKMNEIIKFKDNPDHLYKLGVKWGVIKDFDINWYYNKVVSFKYQTLNLTGIVIEATEITNTWEVENKILHIVVEIPNYKFLKLKTVKSFIKQEIKIERDATEDEISKAKIIKTECLKKVVPEPKPAPKVAPVTDVIGLTPKTNYMNTNIYGFIIPRGNIFRITRTTAKSVFYIDTIQNKERYVSFKNVSNIINRG